ncbi:MAG: VCBS repeat-containing protein [Planctomycetota bacterium]
MYRITTITTCITALALTCVTHAQDCPPDQLFLSPPTYEVAPYGVATIHGDYDGDGDIDMATIHADEFGGINGSGDIVILQNDGFGGFGDTTGFFLAAPARAMTNADVNDDGIMDVVVAKSADGGESLSQLVAVIWSEGSGFDSKIILEFFRDALTIQSADVDGDNDVDFVCIVDGPSASSSILLFRNDGTGSLAIEEGLDAPHDLIESVALDLDMDGDVDVAAIDEDGDVVVLLHNDGNGGFEIGTTIQLNGRPLAIAVADLNGDGLLDLATANSSNDSITTLLRNARTGDFDGNDISLPAIPFGLSLGDYDGDGDIDIASGNAISDDLTILTNDGGGVFTSSSSSDVSISSRDLVSADLDGDGDLEIAVLSVPPSGGQVTILRNDGAGELASNLSIGFDGFARAMQGADFDGDGDLDFAVLTDAGFVRLFTKDSAGGFIQGSQVFVGEDPRSLAKADFDNDGDVDLAVAHDNVVTLLFNNGNGSFVISPLVSVGNDVQILNVIDVDHDGVADIVINRINDIRVYFNDGAAGFEHFSVISDSPASAIADAADLDGDDDVEFILVRSNEIVVLERNELGEYIEASLPFEFPVLEILPTDLDGDNDLDLVVGVLFGFVYFYANDGQNGFSQSQSIEDTLPALLDLVAADFDQDSDIDIAAVGSAALRLLTNDDGVGQVWSTTTIDSVGGGSANGEGSFATDLDENGTQDLVIAGRNITLLLNQCLFDDIVELPADGAANRLDTGDIDNDGDIDVIAALTDTNSAQVFLNNGIANNNPANWLGLNPQAATDVLGPPAAVTLGFLNDDADLDAVLAIDNPVDNDELVLLINSGAGSGAFDPAQTIPLPPGIINDPRDVAVLDYDNDGDADIAVANTLDDTIAILENTGGVTFAFAESRSLGDDPSDIEPSDVDEDKDVDLIVAFASSNTVGILDNINNMPADDAFITGDTFQTGATPVALDGGELNNDSQPDIVTANEGDGTLSILFGQGNGDFVDGFNLPIGNTAVSVVAADFNQDGADDLAAIATTESDPNAAIRIRLKTTTSLDDPGNTSFDPPLTFPIDATPAFLAAADFNLDGEDDLVTANSDAGTTAAAPTPPSESRIANPESLTLLPTAHSPQPTATSSGSVTVLLTNTATVSTLNPDCPADCAPIGGNGDVNVDDLIGVINSFGQTGALCDVAPLNPDGTFGNNIVNVDDLIAVINAFGTCDN